MAGLAILKHTYDLSDEVLCERWVENPYYQFFCGEEFFQHRLPFDRSSLTRWRNRMGEERLTALLQESLSVATRTEAIKPSDLSRVIVDTTVQPKNVTFPTDAKLLNRAREKLVRLAQRHGVDLRQSYARVGKFALIQHQRYAHAKQFKRANRALQEAAHLSRPRHPRHRPQDRRRRRARSDRSPSCCRWPAACASSSSVSAGRRSIPCTRRKWNASARARRTGPTSSASRSPSPPPSSAAKGGQFVTHVKALPGNPYDGHTLATVIPDMEALIGNTIARILADAGYRGHNAPPDYKFRVFISGQKRGVTPQIKRELRRRSAVEPVIGHLKAEHRMGRNYLWFRRGDAINAVLAAAGYNFRRLIRWLRLLLRQILAALLAEPAINPA